jgi:hypothetical protein
MPRTRTRVSELGLHEEQAAVRVRVVVVAANNKTACLADRLGSANEGMRSG